MILGFKSRFVPFVEDGSKTHTIRAYSARRPFEPGDTCHCFANVRIKEMRLIGAWPCLKTEEIEIYSFDGGNGGLVVVINGVTLDPQETELFFWRDGFRPESGRPSRMAAKFWEGRLPFRGQIIHWSREALA